MRLILFADLFLKPGENSPGVQEKAGFGQPGGKVALEALLLTLTVSWKGCRVDRTDRIIQSAQGWDKRQWHVLLPRKFPTDVRKHPGQW